MSATKVAEAESFNAMREALQTIANMPPRLTSDQLIDQHIEMRLVARRALDVVDLCALIPNAREESR